MKKALFLISLIIIATFVYIGYLAVTNNPEENTNNMKNGEDEDNRSTEETNKEIQIKTLQSNEYDRAFESLYDSFNAHTDLLFDDENFGMSYMGELFFLNSSIDREAKIRAGEHVYPVTNDEFDDTFKEEHTVLESYELTNEITGVIAQNKINDEFNFFQSNENNKPSKLQITHGSAMDVDEMKRFLDSLEIPEERKYSKSEFFDLLTIDFNELYALNIDESDIEFYGIDINVFENSGRMVLNYRVKLGETSLFIGVQIERTEEIDYDATPIQLNNGRTIYEVGTDHKAHVWQDEGYEYRVTFYNDESIKRDDKEAILEHFNVPFLSE